MMTLSGYEQDDEGGWAFLSDLEGEEDDDFTICEVEMEIMEEHSFATQEFLMEIMEEEENNNNFPIIDWEEYSWATQEFPMMDHWEDSDDNISIITQEEYFKYNHN